MHKSETNVQKHIRFRPIFERFCKQKRGDYLRFIYRKETRKVKLSKRTPYSTYKL